MSQTLTVSLGAEYIMQRRTLIIYVQINPTFPEGDPCHHVYPPLLLQYNIKDSARGKGVGKERRTTGHTIYSIYSLQERERYPGGEGMG